ncbi:thermonuclease family protein [Caenimonas sp. SL110]|uniref:thermonuclease family protein n=1 Tax=Caenimonas sp. SL110 TaxID=1450524 RepID=UPI000653409F|nr:thermonuclease family protein [Caenimonas sp. SL110]
MAALALSPLAAQAERFAAIVTTVIDGDTVWVRPERGGAARPVRVVGIDAPEICQRFGATSRAELTALVHRRRVVVMSNKRDGNDRVLARLRLGQQDVGEWMVSNGFAWSYRFRGNPGPYAQEEKHARAARAGLWADKDPVMPRDFRVQNGSCRPR